MITLYHYIHCPFCIRVRMALGALKIAYSSQPLPYNDEQTPLDLCGVKMLPILKNGDKAMNESLDIIASLDSSNLLKRELLEDEVLIKELNSLLDRVAKPVHNLCMPYWVYTKEFSIEAREYFIQKKSVKRGPFHKLIQNKEAHLSELKTILDEIENHIDGFYKGAQEMSILDIILASHIWGMYVFPEFQFTPKLHDYLQRVKALCHFEYHEDFWSDEFNQ